MQGTDKYIYLISAAALACAVLLVLVVLLNAPALLAWVAIIGFPVAFGVLVVQLVTSQRPPATPGNKPTVVQHEDGSIEVLR